MTFANKIDKLLEENKIKNLRQLSQELDIPYTTLWDYYSIPVRLEKANLTYIKKIAKRLGCTVDYLAYDDVIEPTGYSNKNYDTIIENTEFINQTNNELNRLDYLLSSRAKQLNDDEKKAVLDVINAIIKEFDENSK